MKKDEFFELPDNKRRDLAAEALCNLIVLENEAPTLSRQLFKTDNIEVTKIILSAYMNGEIN